MTNRQLFEYGDIQVDRVQTYNAQQDLSTKTTERKYNILKNRENTAYQHTEGQNSYQSPSFKQK